MVALWELLGDTVAGLDWMGRLLGAKGRVLPMAAVSLDIAATVAGADPGRPEDVTTVRGQEAVATTPGKVLGISLLPADPPACVEAIRAVHDADWVVLGPGSWFTSVLPHLLVPDLAGALLETGARRVVALNLAPQPGETAGFSPEMHLEVLLRHAPKMRVDVVLADSGAVAHPAELRRVASCVGAELTLEPIAVGDGSPRHDPARLAVAYERIFSRERINPWR
jgi:uncharacterized cofD-like protein